MTTRPTTPARPGCSVRGAPAAGLVGEAATVNDDGRLHARRGCAVGSRQASPSRPRNVGSDRQPRPGIGRPHKRPLDSSVAGIRDGFSGVSAVPIDWMARPTEPAAGTDDYLHVELRVEPHPAVDCPIRDADERGTDVAQDVVRGGERGDGGDDSDRDCRVELGLGGDRRLVSTPVQERCVCAVFRRHDCIASIDAFDGGTLVVSAAVPDREALSALVAGLRAADAEVRLERLTRPTDDGGRRLELRTDRVTERQFEAAVAAVELGYYERPRRADLGDVADRLGVSRSAASQRLTAVESELVGELCRTRRGRGEGTDETG